MTKIEQIKYSIELKRQTIRALQIELAELAERTTAVQDSIIRIRKDIADLGKQLKDGKP